MNERPEPAATALAPALGEVIGVHRGSWLDDLGDRDRQGPESCGLRPSIPFDGVAYRKGSGIIARQAPVGQQFPATRITSIEPPSAATASYATSTVHRNVHGIGRGRPLGGMVSDVKYRWNNRMSRYERVWVLFCTTATLFIVAAQLILDGHL